MARRTELVAGEAILRCAVRLLPNNRIEQAWVPQRQFEDISLGNYLSSDASGNSRRGQARSGDYAPVPNDQDP